MDEQQIDDWRPCANPTCRKPTVIFVLHQCSGLCFDCWLQQPAHLEFRKIEAAVKGGTHRIDAGTAKWRGAKRDATRDRDRYKARYRARERAVRRMADLFPDVFAVLYAEERHKAGLDPMPTRTKNLLTTAVETYVAFAAYHARTTQEDTADGAATSTR